MANLAAEVANAIDSQPTFKPSRAWLYTLAVVFGVSLVSALGQGPSTALVVAVSMTVIIGAPAAWAAHRVHKLIRIKQTAQHYLGWRTQILAKLTEEQTWQFLAWEQRNQSNSHLAQIKKATKDIRALQQARNRQLNPEAFDPLRAHGHLR